MNKNWEILTCAHYVLLRLSLALAKGELIFNHILGLYILTTKESVTQGRPLLL